MKMKDLDGRGLVSSAPMDPALRIIFIKLPQPTVCHLVESFTAQYLFHL